MSKDSGKHPSVKDGQHRYLPKSRFWSLRSKISLFVLAATLITTITVSLISAHSTREFLYSRVEDKLPSLLK